MKRNTGIPFRSIVTDIAKKCIENTRLSWEKEQKSLKRGHQITYTSDKGDLFVIKQEKNKTTHVFNGMELQFDIGESLALKLSKIANLKQKDNKKELNKKRIIMNSSLKQAIELAGNPSEIAEINKKIIKEQKKNKTHKTTQRENKKQANSKRDTLELKKISQK